jgi:hypothetical protein
VGQPEGKRPLGRLTRRREDIIKMYLREIGWGGMDWIDLAEDNNQWRVLVNTVRNLRVPHHVGKFLSGCALGGLQEGLSFVEEVGYMQMTL